MSEDIKRIILVSAGLVLLILLIVAVTLIDVDLKFIKFNSIKTLLGKHDEVNVAEANLKQKETEYNTAIKKVKDMETTFDSEKTKYESISDETINVIKEATTEENYNIEYMWIRLGNYAKSNNLSIVMAEPGGSFENLSVNKDGSESSKSSTTKATTDNTSSTVGSSNKKSTASTTTGDASNTSTTSETDKNTNKPSTSDNNATNSNSNTMFKIQVSGSYLDVSDFIFEVENDKALRFRLDNISMDYVSGTTIRASFNVKNLVINK